jgi:hypothetical protein
VWIFLVVHAFSVSLIVLTVTFRHIISYYLASPYIIVPSVMSNSRPNKVTPITLDPIPNAPKFHIETPAISDSPGQPPSSASQAHSPPQSFTTPNFKPPNRMDRQESMKRAERRAEKKAYMKDKIRGDWLASKFESYETKQFRVGRMLVEDQFQDHGEIPIFKFVIGDRRSELEDKINILSNPEDRYKLLTTRDGAGACIIHIAYLYQKYDIGRSLVEKYPELSVLRYARVDTVDGENGLMPYLGENIMHMAIASRNYEEVKWLIDLHNNEENPRPDLLLQMLSARCFGHFFQPEFNRIGVYFGELPIHFAVCSNDLDILDLLVDADPNSLFFIDSHGNNALHLCVLHSLERMYDYVIMHAENIIRTALTKKSKSANAEDVKRILNEQLLYVYNNNALTPFTLAASEGKEEMFRHMMHQRRKQLWSYGPVDCSVVDLTNLDTIRLSESDQQSKHSGIEFKSMFAYIPSSTSADTVFEQYRYPPLDDDADMGDCHAKNRMAGEKLDKMGAIECICKNNHIEMLDVPEVREIIAKKWERFGFPTFLASSIFGFLRTILITLIICTFAYSEGESGMDHFALALYPVTSLFMIYNFINDIKNFLNIGFKQFGYGGLVRGAAMLENICSALECIFFITACVVKISLYYDDASNDDAPVRIFIALTALTCWVRIYYILMGFQMTGNFVVIVSTILTKDIPLFMWIYVTILMGFGSCHAVLSRIENEERSVKEGFKHFFSSIWGMFRYTFDGQNFHIFDEAEVSLSNEWLYQILLALYNLCIVLLMLNLLIAMMSETYSDLIGKSNIILARERYNMMCAFELGMPQEQIVAVMKNYAIQEINSLPSFEMQTMNLEWVGKGSAATADFDDKMRSKHVDMLPELRLQAHDGEAEALEISLHDRPEMLNSRDEVGICAADK